MKLRTKLILAFLLLAVIPPTFVSLYSYRSSLAAFRQVTEAESMALADDMAGRMESVRAELGRRIERLGSFPFHDFMARAQHGPRNAGGGARDSDLALSRRLMAEIGDAAGLVEGLEFTPFPPPPPPPPPSPAQSRGQRAAVSRLPASGSGTRSTPEQLVIQLPPFMSASPGEILPPTESNGKRMVIRIPQSGSKAPSPEELAAAAQAAETMRRSLQVQADIARAKAEALKAAALKPEPGPYTFTVRTDGEVVGTLKAQVSTRRVMRTVLSRTRRKQGEIPFALDAQNVLHTTSESDQQTLEKQQVLASVREGASQTALANWIVVSRKEPESGITFGIARPVRSSVEEIRQTAVRNLGLGLGVVALALLGILPLSNRMTRDLKVLTNGADRLARGALDTRVQVRSGDEFGRLAQAFNRMAEDLSEHEKNLVEQERLRKELEMCRRIQEDLLPQHPLSSGFVEAKGISIPAREVGGDFFNYFPLANGNVGLLVGDVSGKGLPAALLMANLQATIQAKLPLESDLARLAAQLDYDIDQNMAPELYLTLFMATMDVHSGVLRYVNAGHNTQFALHADGTMDAMESTGRPLGLLPGGGYVERSVALHPGDSLFLYTDGLVEAENEAGEEFGMARLQNLLAESRTEPLETMLTKIDDGVRRYRGTVEAADDATMLVLKVV